MAGTLVCGKWRHCLSRISARQWMSSGSASLKSQKSEIRLWVFFRQGAFSCRSIGTTIGNALMYFPKAALTACGGRAWPISMTKSPTPIRRSEEHTSELQSLMRISYAVFCLKKKNDIQYCSTTHSHHSTKHKQKSKT